VVTKKQRERALARQKWERQQARRVEQHRKAKRRGIIGGAVVLVLAVGFGTAGIWWVVRDDGTAAPNPTATATTPAPESSVPVELPLLTTPTPTPTSSQ
jgi:peptidyl-prolyl cis-trans isomerase B (cyclophilin B)